MGAKVRESPNDICGRMTLNLSNNNRWSGSRDRERGVNMSDMVTMDASMEMGSKVV